MDKTLLNLEHQITAFVNSDNKNACTVHFDYQYSDDGAKGMRPEMCWTVNAHTYNPVTGETFLLKSMEAKSKDIGLKKILDALKKQKGESSFTVKWSKRGTPGMNESYFFVHDVLDVVENFFHGKNPEEYVVYEIKLNPIS